MNSHTVAFTYSGETLVKLGPGIQGPAIHAENDTLSAKTKALLENGYRINRPWSYSSPFDRWETEVHKIPEGRPANGWNRGRSYIRKSN